MTMADGKTSLRKIAFQIGTKFFRFAINPENYTHAKPHRTTAVKTKSRIVVEDFQSDIPTISIKGSTGFNPTGRAEDRGLKKIQEMKAYIEWYAEMGGNGRTASEDFYFHNFTNDESFVVHLAPEGVSFSQDVSSPLTYHYEINFVVLRKSTEPADEDIVDPEIGNRFPSITYSPPRPVMPSYGLTPVTPLVPNNGINMPSPLVPNNGVTMPNPIINYPGFTSPVGNGNAGGSGNTSPGSEDVYNDGTTTPYNPGSNNQPINPQAPSPTAYYHGTSGLGYAIGFYGRSYSV